MLQESRFSPVRLREIARDRFPSLPALSLDRMVEHCIVYSVQSMQSLIQTLGQLEEVCALPCSMHCSSFLV